MAETDPEKRDNALARWLKRFQRQPKERISPHHRTDQRGNTRSMTKAIPSRVRRANRQRNKVARASRKANNLRRRKS